MGKGAVLWHPWYILKARRSCDGLHVSGGLHVVLSIFFGSLCVGTLRNVVLSPWHLGMRGKVGLQTNS